MALDFLKNIPVLKNIDLTDPQTRKNALLLLGCLAAVIIIIILAIPTNKNETPIENTENTSDTPPVQDGTDRDNLESKSIINLRERKRSDNGSFARRMFAESDNLEEILKNDQDGGSKDSISSSQGDAQSPVDITDPLAVIAAAQTESEKQYSERFGEKKSEAQPSPQGDQPKAKAATVVPSGNASSSQQASTQPMTVQQAAEARRQRVRELGFDPDTGLPLDMAATQPQQEPQQSVKEEEKPDAQPPEGIEKASVSVRGKGSMSSFGTGKSSTESGFSSFGSREEEAVSSGAKFFKVAFAYNEKVKTGQRVTLRLREKITVDGYELPINSIVYATCTAKDDRLMLKVKNIDINGKAYYLNYSAVDVDWEDGLYCPSKANSTKLKQAVQEGVQIVSSTAQSLITGVPGRIISSGTSMATNSSGDVTVTVTEGYEFYLVPTPERN